MSLFSHGNRHGNRAAMAGLLAALALGSSTWSTSAEARVGGHFGGAHFGGGHFGAMRFGGYGGWHGYGRPWHAYGWHPWAGRYYGAWHRYGYPRYAYYARPYYGSWGPYYDGWDYGWYPWGLGAIVGGAIASAPAYSVAQSADPNWISECEQHYRSFNPATGTYLGYDGRQHVCRL